MPSSRRWFPTLVALLTLWALPSSAAAQQRDQPSASTGMRLPIESVTTQADVTSLETNPAGLGLMNGAEAAVGLQVADDDLRGVLPEGTGLFLGGGTGTIGGGVSVQWLDRPGLRIDQSDYRKYTLGGAISTSGNFSFGVAANLFGSSDSASLDDMVGWDVGMMWRPSEHVGFGLHARDLNQPFLTDDVSLPIRTGLGVALRFFNGRLILDPQVKFTSDGDSLFLSPRIQVEPIDGVRLFGRTRFDFEFRDNEANTSDWTTTTFGLALNTSSLGVEYAAHTDLGGRDSAWLGNSVLAWVSPNKRRGLLTRDRRWVLIDLTGGIAEQPISSLLGPSTPSFMSLAVKLERLADDDAVAGVVFNVGDSDLGYGQIWEVRQAIGRLRAAGKHTVTMLTNPTYRETYLGSAAEHVWILPSQTYAPDGLSLTLASYAGTLAKAGIQAEFVRIGRYKSSPETFTYRHPSEENLAQTTRFLDGLFSRTTAALADDRDMEVEEVKDMIGNVPLYPADAVKQGFVDDVVYLDAIEQRLRTQFGRHVSLQRDYPRPKPARQRWGTRPEIAVVVVEGAIVRGRSGRAPLVDQMVTGSDSLTEIFDQLRRDPMVRGVVVRIDSPGGSAVASDLIYRQMRRLAQRKPVVASMGNMAASGGYYVAAGADEILATPNTLTGSIGIFSGKFSISKLADFLGINTTQLGRGQQSGAFDLYRPWTPQQKDSVIRSITYLYGLFIQQVARTRPLSPDQVDAVARGHIWDGVSAKKRKLVDATGGLMAAIHRTEQLAGVKPAEVDYQLYPDTIGLFDLDSTSVSASLIDTLGAHRPSGPAVTARSVLGRLIRQIGKGLMLPALYDDGEALTLLPQVVELH